MSSVTVSYTSLENFHSGMRLISRRLSDVSYNLSDQLVNLRENENSKA